MTTARFVALAASALLAGCGANLAEIGKPPEMSAVGAGLEPASATAYAYPQTPAPPVKRFSLWDDRQSHMFKDARALSTGDILTVLISINDKAALSNESDRSRTANRSLDLDGSYDVAGAGSSASAGANIGSTTTHSGTGETVRSEKIQLQIAAVVTDVLPNGNLIIRGSQEVRVNAELRVLTIAGIVRPADIGGQNSIPYERIAEARISYGGRGRLTEVQQPPYGQQFLDQVLPF